MDQEIKVFLGGWDSRVSFAEQLPVLTSAGVTMVPLRRIYELLGAEVTWDAVNERVVAKYGDNTVELKIGEPFIIVNGEVKELGLAPYIDATTSRTLVPLRAVSEGLGAKVSWEESIRSILIEPLP